MGLVTIIRSLTDEALVRVLSVLDPRAIERVRLAAQAAGIMASEEPSSMGQLLDRLETTAEPLSKYKPGDVLELKLARAPIYASSGPGTGKETMKRVTVRKVVTTGGKKPDVFLSVMDNKRTIFRLELDRKDNPTTLFNYARGGGKWDVLDVKVVKRA